MVTAALADEVDVVTAGAGEDGAGADDAGAGAVLKPALRDTPFARAHVAGSSPSGQQKP
jgi:hypothetical protein